MAGHQCYLCKKREATQTGSHITSCFFVSSQIGERGEEEAYRISDEPSQDYTVNQGAGIVVSDHILCTICEKRLSLLESIVATEYTQKLSQKELHNDFELTTLKGHSILKLKKLNPIVFILYLYSVIFRAHIANSGIYRYFRLDEPLAEKLRVKLDALLIEYDEEKFKFTEKRNQWLKGIENCRDIFDEVDVVVIRPIGFAENGMNASIYEIGDDFVYQFAANDHIIYICDKGRMPKRLSGGILNFGLDKLKHR